MAEANWLCAPAAEGIHAPRNPEVEAGRGGVAIGIKLEIAPYISHEGVSTCHKAVWICLIHPDWGRIGLVGIYGPNMGEGRTALWNELFHSLDSSYRWIMLGDFNMTDAHGDQWGGTRARVFGREGRAWQNLTRKFLLVDTFNPRRGHLCFSWDSMRIHRHNQLMAPDTRATKFFAVSVGSSHSAQVPQAHIHLWLSEFSFACQLGSQRATMEGGPGNKLS